MRYLKTAASAALPAMSLGRLLTGWSAAVPLAVFCVSSAVAQEAPNIELQEVVVSASHINRDGFQAPTPVTVVGSEDIEKRAVTSVGELLNQLPAFRGSQSPAQATSTATGTGFTFADLRGMGSQRTLVLVDGRRHVPTATTGQVDLNLIPSILIERAEVVTGGASAAWGSDAVAGVANLVLKHKIKGLQADLSGGISQQGDNKEAHAGVAGGLSFAGGSGNVTGGLEYVDNRGVGDSSQRAWGRQDYGIATNPTPGVNGYPSRIIAPNFYQAALAAGGIVTSGPLRGTTFLTGGIPTAFQYGQVFGTGMFGPGTTGITQQIGVIWKVPVKRYVGLVNVDYDFSDRLSGFAQLSYAHSASNAVNGFPRDTALTVRRDNAFLPVATLASMTANNLQTISIGRFDLDLPIVRPVNSSATERAVVGLSGKMGGSWNWKAYYQFGRNHYHVDILDNRVNANWQAAIDAVSANGVITCRNPALVTNGVTAQPGCVPFNIFGQGSASNAAVAYVTASGWGDTVVTQNVAAVDVSGDAFNTWAGAVSVAAGVEYRKEIADSGSDTLSQQTAFNIGNPQPLRGNYNVREVYGEAVVPLLAQKALAKSLELNTAARSANYSTSGSINTWKVGLTYAPIDGLRIRATRSRDIRAPNISELYAQSQYSLPVVINRWTGLGSNIQVNNNIGNPNLKPERANTETVGIVLQPTFIPGFEMSVDYYKITMADQITTIGAQTLVDRCFAGATEYCKFVIGAGTSTITRVDNANLNLNGFRTVGTDIELSYRTGLSRFVSAARGDITFRAFATRVKELTTIDSVSAINRVGQLGAQGGVPTWTVDGQLSYHVAALTTTVNLHHLSAGKYDATLFGPGEVGYSITAANSININHVDGVTYTALSVQYDLVHSGSRNVQVYGSVKNLFDIDPPPSPTGATVMNGVFFDPVGRTYSFGIRVKM